MAAIVNTNIGSLYSQMHLAKTEDMRDKATERLSSGNKINTAADDAAGRSMTQLIVLVCVIILLYIFLKNIGAYGR